jgi:acyl transferase domain-containing protein
LVNLLRQWHVLPTAVVGHSSGEIAAAYAAGALGMKEALLVSYYRGVATSELQRPGTMAAIGLGRHDLEDLLVGNVALACENSRSSVTISGDLDDVEASLDRVSRMRPGVLARKLKIDRAYHSGK